MRRVVVTGYGVVSALGTDKAGLAQALAAGRTGVAPVALFDTGGCRCHQAAVVDWVGAEVQDRAQCFLARAAAEALADAGLASGLARLAVFQGSAHGALDRWEQDADPCGALPANLGHDAWHALAETVAVTTVTSACVASTWATGLALNAIRRGTVDLAVVAGVEPLTGFLFRGFDALRSLSMTRCRPFDRRRDGLILGEGAAVLVLEEAGAARRRGVPIRAEVAGFGAAADAYHLTAPELGGKGAAAALARALDDAGIAREADYINLHGTGTAPNDQMEINALQRVFGSGLGRIAVSGTKGLTGHTSGAAGALELAVCLTVLEHDLIPPTYGLEEPEAGFADVDLVRAEPRRRHCRTVISTNSAFGGSNAAVVLRRYP